MFIHRDKKIRKSTISGTIYILNTRWYLPLGLAWANRYSKNPNVYYSRLLEVSIGFLCCRLHLQWYWKNKPTEKNKFENPNFILDFK